MSLNEADRLELLQFFAGHFNQDFLLLRSWIGEQSSDGVMAFILANYSVHVIQGYLAALERLQDLNLPESELHRLMYKLGAEWNPTTGNANPSGWPRTNVEWLDQIITKLRAGLKARIQSDLR